MWFAVLTFLWYLYKILPIFNTFSAPSLLVRALWPPTNLLRVVSSGARTTRTRATTPRDTCPATTRKSKCFYPIDSLDFLWFRRRALGTTTSWVFGTSRRWSTTWRWPTRKNSITKYTDLRISSISQVWKIRQNGTDQIERTCLHKQEETIFSFLWIFLLFLTL